MLNIILIVIMVVTLILFEVTRLAADRLMHQHYEQKSDFFRHYAIQPGDIVFVGDSLTDGARWSELFPGLPVKNRGINADTTAGVLKRVDEITSGNPAAVFLLIGTNDLVWYSYCTDPGILNTYETILKRFKLETPDTQVFVQSLLPRRRSYAKRIQGINAAFEKLAAQYGYAYIDLFPHFARKDGELRDELTNDKLHLLAVGYAIWAETLTPYLDGLKRHA
jgi:lysophospholipase L1-like esterase